MESEPWPITDEYNRPPPYFCPNFIPEDQQFNLTPSTLDHLSVLLNDCKQFTFCPTGRLGFFGRRTVMVQIRNGIGLPILSVLSTPGGKIVPHRIYHDNRINPSTASTHLGDTINFLDVTGRVLITGKESDGTKSTITVTNGEELVLGILEGREFFSTRITAKNSIGQHLFEIEGQRSSHKGCGDVVNFEEFRILSHGIQIGKLAKGFDSNRPQLIGVSMSHTLNIRTKAILLMAAHDIFMNYMVGSRGLSKNVILSIFIGVAIVCLLLVILPILTILAKNPHQDVSLRS